MDLERRFVELRSDGRSLTGTAVVYGSETRIADFREKLMPQAFGDLSNVDAILNVQHQPTRPLARTGAGLELRDSAERLEIVAALPQTRDAEDTLSLIEAGVLRGLSLEFRAIKERWSGDLRTIERAKIYGVAVVDRPAYDDAVVQIAKRYLPSAVKREVSWWL